MFGVQQEPYVHSKPSQPSRVTSCNPLRPGRAQYNRAMGQLLNQEAQGMIGRSQERGLGEGAQALFEGLQEQEGVREGA
jgi:hypothetical protein